MAEIADLLMKGTDAFEHKPLAKEIAEKVESILNWDYYSNGKLFDEESLPIVGGLISHAMQTYPESFQPLQEHITSSHMLTLIDDLRSLYAHDPSGFKNSSVLFYNLLKFRPERMLDAVIDAQLILANSCSSAYMEVMNAFVEDGYFRLSHGLRNITISQKRMNVFRLLKEYKADFGEKFTEYVIQLSRDTFADSLDMYLRLRGNEVLHYQALQTAGIELYPVPEPKVRHAVFEYVGN